MTVKDLSAAPNLRSDHLLLSKNKSEYIREKTFDADVTHFKLLPEWQFRGVPVFEATSVLEMGNLTAD